MTALQWDDYYDKRDRLMVLILDNCRAMLTPHQRLELHRHIGESWFLSNCMLDWLSGLVDMIGDNAV